MDDTKPQDSAVSTQEKTDQKQIDAAVAALGNDAAIEKEGTKVEVEEHQISDEEAKKYAGAGDFSLPITASPLDDLIGKNQEQEAKKEQQPAPVSQPTAMPQPAVDPKDLEKKAQSLLQELDGKGKNAGNGEAGGIKPKKKRSGTAVKMALAAVLVVIMGAGGVVGMNLLKMQQVAENRSKAEGCPPDNNCIVGDKICQGEGAKLTGYECTCVDLSSNSCPDTTSWSCGTYNPSKCTPENVPPSGECSVNNPQACCSYNTCDVGSLYPSTCFVSHFFSPKKDTQRVYVNNCRVQPNEGDVETLLCAGQSASFSKDCGVEQIDITCNGSYVAQISRRYDIDCGDFPPSEESEPLSCSGLNKDKSSVKIGDVVTLTCSHSGDGKDRYEYRYKVTGDADWTVLGTNNSFTVTKAGEYTAQCRVCKADNTCTAWGLAK